LGLKLQLKQNQEFELQERLLTVLALLQTKQSEMEALFAEFQENPTDESLYESFMEQEALK
jgi:DNA-directed RNA polymerase specialized sigma54-like protein